MLDKVDCFENKWCYDATEAGKSGVRQVVPANSGVRKVLQGCYAVLLPKLSANACLTLCRKFFSNPRRYETKKQQSTLAFGKERSGPEIDDTSKASTESEFHVEEDHEITKPGEITHMSDVDVKVSGKNDVQTGMVIEKDQGTIPANGTTFSSDWIS